MAEVIAGEAVSGSPEERMADMRAIASVIANRAALLGVTPEEVVSNSREFNAYNKSLPPGVNQDLVDMAQQAVDYVSENGPVNNATFYATPAAADNLPNGLNYETATTGHQYFSDPQNRAIGTANGFVQPNQYAYAQNINEGAIPTPYAANDLSNNSLLSAFSATPTYSEDPFSSILSGNVPATPAVQATGILGGTPALEAATKAGVPGGPSGIFDGVVTPGNIDLAHRELATMPDGSMATVRSMSFENNAGNEVLVPTVSPTGELLSDQQAKELYGTTGQHLGIFDSPANADKYAEALHQAQEKFYAPSETVPASGLLSGNAPLSADATVGILSNATPSERMGIAEPGFDASRFDGVGPQVATVDASRFATPAKTDRIGALPGLTDTARMNPLTGAIDPATNTQSFMDTPAATVSVPAGGILAGNQPMEAQATVPSLASAYTAPTAVTPAEQAITNNFSLNSPQDIAATVAKSPSLVSPAGGILSGGPLTSSVTSPDLTGKSIIGAQPQQQNAFAASFPAAVANNTFEPAAINDVVAAPTLDTIQVAEQPTIAGPTEVNPVEQQQTQAITAATQPAKPQATVQAAQNTKSFKDSLLSKETALGSILGGAVLGVPGAILGGAIGQQTAQGGGLTGLLSGTGGFVAPTTQIGGGINNIAGIYGGQYAPGTYSVANNGTTVTAQPGGYTNTTNSYGVSETVSPTGQISHNFGSLFGGPSQADQDKPSIL